MCSVGSPETSRKPLCNKTRKSPIPTIFTKLQPHRASPTSSIFCQFRHPNPSQNDVKMRPPKKQCKLTPGNRKRVENQLQNRAGGGTCSPVKSAHEALRRQGLITLMGQRGKNWHFRVLILMEMPLDSPSIPGSPSDSKGPLGDLFQILETSLHSFEIKSLFANSNPWK